MHRDSRNPAPAASGGGLVLALSLIAVLFSACSSSRRSDTGDASVMLFDGRTLNGWVQRGGRADYFVEDGVIVGRTTANEPNSFLCTTEEFDDFSLELEFKVDPALNSGVQIRSESRADYRDGRVHGYQVEIDPSPRAWTGGIYDESRRGWLADLRNNEPARAAFRPGEWNQLRIEAIGPHLRTWINGVPAAEIIDSMTTRGFIALQVHDVGPRTDPLEVRWRRLKILAD